MPNQYSTTDLLNFLDHAAERGLMPAATASAFAVAARKVFEILSDEETLDVRVLDLDALTRRFQNKRAHDFTPGSLKTYASRVRRAVDLFVAWRDNPANFSIKTRSTAASRRREGTSDRDREPPAETSPSVGQFSGSEPSSMGTYHTAFPLRPGRIVSLLNVPDDLSLAEAERLAQFVRMLALESRS